MSLKYEIETWAEALAAYDQKDLQTSLRLFLTIGDNSKIMFNMGLIRAALGEHQAAVELLSAAIRLDRFFAVAYHQIGVSNFLLGRFRDARRNFDDAFLYLRGNNLINYEQIGLDFKLFSAEVLFNRGLCNIYLGEPRAGLIDLERARQNKQSPEHDVIDEAILAKGHRYTVFSIPVGILYRPSASKVKNAKTKDYIGQAKLIAATDDVDALTTFVPRPRTEPSSSTVPPSRPVDLARSKSMAGNGLTRMFSRRKAEPTLIRANSDLPSIPSASSSRPDRSNTVGTAGKHLPPPLDFRSNHLPPPPADAFFSTVSTRTSSPQHARSLTYGGMPGILGRFDPGLGEWGERKERMLTGAEKEKERYERKEEEEEIVFAGSDVVQAEEDEVDKYQSVIDELYGDYYTSESPNYNDNRLSTKAIFHLPTAASPPSSPYTSPRTLPQPPRPPAESAIPSWIQNSSTINTHSNNLRQHPSHSAADSTSTLTSTSSYTPLATPPPYISHHSSPLGRSTSTASSRMGDYFGLMSLEGNGGREKAVLGDRRCAVKVVDSRSGSPSGLVVGSPEGMQYGLGVEMTRVRLLIHYAAEVRALTFPTSSSSSLDTDVPPTTLLSLLSRLRSKFSLGLDEPLKIDFTDEVGLRIRLADEDDWDVALDVARINGRGRSEGRLEIWINDDST